MKTLFVLTLFLAVSAEAQTSGQVRDDSPLEVLEFRWFPDRQPPPKADVQVVVPARAVIPENKNFQRKAREQGTPGTIDPNEHTVDGRSAAMEKIVQESRTAKRDAVAGFLYHVVMRNAAEQRTEVVFWEYQFKEIANPANVVRRQFLCSVKLKPGEKMELKVFSLVGPSDTISAESLARDTGKIFDEEVSVNRIEYASGAILQRHDWNYKEFKPAIERAVSAPWGRETCRAF